MRILFFIFLFGFGASFQPVFAQGPSLTLQDAFEKALKRSESVAITKEEIQHAQARFYRSLGYFLPAVHFEVSNTWQDVPADAVVSDDTSSSSRRRSTPERKFTFSQPLFSGLKEIAALQGSGADKKQQRAAWKRAQELLFVDVMESFYTVLQAEKNVEVLMATHELLGRRYEELEERAGLGRSRETELKTALADKMLIESDLVIARNQARAAKNLLEFYTGESLENTPLKEEAPEDLKDPEVRIQESARARADVVADELEYYLTKKRLMVARGTFLPTVSLDGNYYVERVGFQSGNDWDMKLKLDVPVFEFAENMGDVTEASANREQARLQYRRTLRLAELEIRDAWEALEFSRTSEKALRLAETASRESYDILTEEYRLNLVNNLQVLDTLRRSNEVRLRYYDARYEAFKNYWKLRVALGDVPGVKV